MLFRIFSEETTPAFQNKQSWFTWYIAEVERYKHQAVKRSMRRNSRKFSVIVLRVIFSCLVSANKFSGTDLRENKRYQYFALELQSEWVVSVLYTITIRANRYDVSYNDTAICIHASLRSKVSITKLYKYFSSDDNVHRQVLVELEMSVLTFIRKRK